MKDHFSLQEIEQAISRARPEEQRRFLKDLPRLLKIQPADLSLLKISEPSFDFWNNPEDAVYDGL